MNLQEYLLNHSKSNRVSFHMPGHKGLGIFNMYGYGELMKNLVNMDITEIAGADNLHKPKGIIKNLEDKYAELYGAKKTFLLIDGSTAGILASIMACVPTGKKILAARNCHKSVYSGTVLTKCVPTYVMPKHDKTFHVMGEITAEDVRRILEEDFRDKDEIYAVILASPNYYGICSNVEEIAEVVHRYGKILIVDQAHGAHLKFFEKNGYVDDLKKDSVSEKNIERGGRNYRYLTYPRSAESSGADIVINSTHKTLSSFTQSAVLNVMTDRVDERNIFDKLQLVQSTSLSYILMLSLDINADIIEKHGDEVFANWKNNVKRFYEQMAKIPEVTVVEDENLDWTKINLSLEKMGIDGGTFEKLLTDRGIDAELAAGNIVMALTGIGNSLEDYGKLLHAVKDIVWSIKERRKSKLRENVDYNSCESSVCDMDIRRRRSEIDADERKETCGDEKSTSDEQLNKTGCKGDESMIKFSVEDSDCISVDNGFSIPKPGDYIGTEGESAEVYLRDSMGCISKDAIIPYPPGIPFVCPGEIITEECVKRLLQLMGENKDIFGISREGKIRIIIGEDKQ